MSLSRGFPRDHRHIQAGYAQDAENDTHTAAVTWLDAWSDVLGLCDATGISSIGEFDDRFPMSQSLFNWSQDLEMALENAGRDDGEIRRAARTAGPCSRAASGWRSTAHGWCC